MKGAPPFRADHVGSLLRPPVVKQARADRAAGRITALELAVVENAAVDRVVRKQTELGLRVVTDGELRRGSWLGDFFAHLAGTTLVPMQIRSGGAASATALVPTVTGRVAFSGHPMLEHFTYLASRTSLTPKVSIPAPSMLVSVMRDWRGVVDRGAYPDIALLYRDLAVAYGDIVAAFHAAGCRYLQFDDVNLAYLCDAEARARLRARGDDPEELLEIWSETLNTALAARPADMVVTTHLCRGNFRSRWFAEGGYEPIADALFNRFNYDGYFLEYDSERAGGFEPLRYLPDGSKFVVLGLITTKTGALESKDVIKARVEAASAFVPVDRLCISPQCGFASTEEGNLLTEEEQWAKLAEVVEVAGEIWPGN
jgi:5-methyltetrahydropteroyltriglutamate--homocysteine methyltransferase